MGGRRRSLVVIAATVSLVLPAATTATAGRFPTRARTEFIKGCMRGGGPRAACKCMIRKIERRYTLAEFLEVLGETSDGSLPRPLTRIVRSCKRAYT